MCKNLLDNFEKYDTKYSFNTHRRRKLLETFLKIPKNIAVTEKKSVKCRIQIYQILLIVHKWKYLCIIIINYKIKILEPTVFVPTALKPYS